MTPKDEDFSRVGDLLGDGVGAVAGQGRAGRPRTRPKLPAPAAPDSGFAGSPRQAGGGGDDVARDLALAWPEAVGEEVAANSQPVRFSQGRLTVAASSTAWAQTLSFMEATIARNLNQKLGNSLISRITFQHAGWERRAVCVSPLAGSAGGDESAGRAPTAPREGGPQLTAEQEAALRGVEQMGLTPDLEATILRAMRAAFVRGEQQSVR